MKSLLIGIFSFVLISLNAQAQLASFSNLSSVGDIPDEFFPDEEMIDESINDWIELSNNALSKAEAKKYVEKQNLAVTQLLESGKILFNDPVTKYLDKILDNVLVEDPELRAKIKVFTFKSNTVNAFMMPNGMMFVNIGLVAETTNEAQLAFVLSHEIIHFTKHHSIDQYIERLNKDWDRDNFVSELLNYHARSRLHETESDNLGLEEFYTTSKYSYDAIPQAFDVLQYGYLPFDEMRLERTAVETKDFRFKDRYFLEEVNAIRSRDDYVDTLSTHPNIRTRRYDLGKKLSRLNNEGRKDFVQDESLFYTVRDLARFECINQYLYDKDFVEAYYNINILQRDYPENKFLEVAEATSLYGIEKFTRKYHRDFMPSEKEMEGEIHSAVHFFRKISKNELTLLALRNTWFALKKYPDDKYLSDICDDLLNNVHTKVKADLYDFADLGINDTLVEVEEVEEEETKGSKYDRVKKGKKIQAKKGWKTWNYMLVDIKSDSSFVDRFYRTLKNTELDKIFGEISLKKLNTKEVKEQPISVVVINPKFYQVKQRSSIDRIDEDKVKDKSDKLVEQFARCSELLNVDYRVISNSTLEQFSYETYSNYMQLYSEFIKQKESGMELYSYRNLFNDTTFKDEYILFLNQVSYRQGFVDLRTYVYSLMGFLNTPFFPVSMYELFMPRYRTIFVYHMFHSSPDDNMIEEPEVFNEKLREDYILQHLYNSLYKSKYQILLKQKEQND